MPVQSVRKLLRRSKSEPVDEDQKFLEEVLRQHHQGGDPEENADTRLPSGEWISYNALWVAECYAPSDVSTLVDRVRDLGWDDSGAGSADGWSSLGQWIIESRSVPGSSWHNLGLIADESDSERRFRPHFRRSALPEDVDHALGVLIKLVPGLFIIVIQFVLKDDVSEKIEAAFNTTYQTYADPTRSGWRFHTPRNQKEEHIRRIRLGILTECTNWFSHNIPGVFSSSTIDRPFPTCEFLSLKLARPFSNESRNFNHYLSLMDMSHDWDVWENHQLPGLRLNHRGSLRGAHFNITLAGLDSEIFLNEDLDRYGGRNRHGYTHYMSLIFHESMALWAVHALLAHYERMMEDARGDLASLVVPNGASNRELHSSDLENTVVDLIGDIIFVPDELILFYTSKPLVGHRTGPWIPVRREMWSKPAEDSPISFLTRVVALIRGRKESDIRLEPIYLTVLMQDSFLLRCERIRKTGVALRELATISSSIRGARTQEILAGTNVKLQQRLLWFTIVMVVMVVIQLIVAIGVGDILDQISVVLDGI